MNDAPATSTTERWMPQGDEEGIDPQRLEEIAERCSRIRRQVEQIFIGPAEIIESLLVAVLARGHILLEGVPGVAKTTLCRAFAATLDARFRRVQFTPDLLPADITGTYVPDLQNNEFQLRKGPVFANVLLGDEINRAPAKTQSALLEAMQERQVTIEGNTHRLPAPFIVLATQNPVEQQGVYPLPEAQLDRFLLKIVIDYPSESEELEVLKTHRQRPSMPSPIVDGQQIEQLAQLAESVHVSEEMMSYVLGLTRRTRKDQDVTLGASPRGSLALMRAAQARALIEGRDYVIPDDIRRLATAVLAHRIMVDPDAQLDGLSGEDIVDRTVRQVRYG